jgi:hypothetical protein
MAKLKVHALEPVAGGHLGPGRHLRESAEDSIQEAVWFRMGKTSHQRGRGKKSWALHDVI